MTVRTRAYFAALASLTQTDMADLFESALMDEDATATGRSVLGAANAAAARSAIGAGVGDMVAANNLSEVATPATARTNLGLGDVATLAKDTDGTLAANSDTKVATQKATKTYVDAAVGGVSAAPTGSVVMWMLNTVPTGWLACEGANVSRATYAALFAVLGTTYGVGDGSTTFGLPDFTSLFPRGAADPTSSPTGGSDTHDHGAATGSNTTGISVSVPTVNNRTAGGAVNAQSGAATVTDPGHTHSVSSASNVPAYRKVRFIIKT